MTKNCENCLLEIGVHCSDCDEGSNLSYLVVILLFIVVLLVLA